MNDYRIIAKDAATGDDLTRIITERSDKAARQAFDKMHRDTPHEITGSELVKENTTATKQQERDALAKIRAMVEELGPDSYLAAAFAGCFELADLNIEYDFGDSMKARAESANRDAEKAQKELAAAKGRIAELESEIASLKEKLEREEEWKPYEDPHNVSQADYEALSGTPDARELSDEEAADLIAKEFGFDRSKIAIVHEVAKEEINRHNRIRNAGMIPRKALFDVWDWNYICFNVRGNVTMGY